MCQKYLSMIKKLVLIAAVALVSACGTPSVQYQLVVSDSDGQNQPVFRLPSTWVSIAASQTKGAAPAPGTSIATGAPVSSPAALEALRTLSTIISSDTGTLIAIIPKNNLWNSTNLSYTYYDNSKMLLKSVGIAYQDNTVKVIQTGGAILSDLVPLVAYSALMEKPIPGPAAPAAKPAPALDIPFVFDLGRQDAWHDWVPVPQATGWSYRVVPTDADRQRSNINVCDVFKIPHSLDSCTLPTTAAAGTSTSTPLETDWTGNFPVSTCVDVDLQLALSDEVKVAGVAKPPSGIVHYMVTVADPVYIRMIPLPEKGTITMHTVCGADLAVDSSDTRAQRQLDAVQAAFDQAKAIKAARDAKK